MFFFDNVRIPANYLVGHENGGWTVAKYLLEFERGGGSSAGRLMSAFDRLRRIALSEVADDGGLLADDPVFCDRIMQIEARVMAIDWTERLMVAARGTGDRAGAANASMMKLLASEVSQDIAELSLEALGVCAAVDQQEALGSRPTRPGWGLPHTLLPAAAYLNGRAVTIFGGSSEIQKNILARVALHI